MAASILNIPTPSWFKGDLLLREMKEKDKSDAGRPACTEKDRNAEFDNVIFCISVCLSFSMQAGRPSSLLSLSSISLRSRSPLNQLGVWGAL